MNSFYRYEYEELWKPESWEGRHSRIRGLIHYLGEHCRLCADDYREPDWESREEELRHFHAKSGSTDDPVLLHRLKTEGLTAARFDMAEHWMAVLPSALCGTKTCIPALVICLSADYKDSYWAMKILYQGSAYQKAALAEGFALLYVVSNQGPDRNDTFVNIFQEAITRYHCDTERFYLDVTPLIKKGVRLRDIPDCSLMSDGGVRISNPDDAIVRLFRGSVYAVPLKNSWEERKSLAQRLVTTDQYSLRTFDREWFLHSLTAKRMARGLWIEHRFDIVEDPELVLYYRKRGVSLTVHESAGERWLTLSPAALNGPLPLLCVMQEVCRGNEHLAVTALGYFDAVSELVAAGECIALYFVLEDADANDRLAELIRKAAALYPIDSRRVYVTGHSHNGRYALEFATRNADVVAACATLGNFCGVEIPANPEGTYNEEDVKRVQQIDLPLINLCGCQEHGGKLPLNRAAADLPVRPGQQYGRITALDARIHSWQQRLRAWNCPVASRDEILAAAESDDIVERILGFPVDRSFTVYGDGYENYIGDLRNAGNKYRLRMVGMEGLPHVPTPFMLELAWDWLRRFARDPETGRIEELITA